MELAEAARRYFLICLYAWSRVKTYIWLGDLWLRSVGPCFRCLDMSVEIIRRSKSSTRRLGHEN